jgi:hypothetical protein
MIASLTSDQMAMLTIYSYLPLINALQSITPLHPPPTMTTCLNIFLQQAVTGQAKL